MPEIVMRRADNFKITPRSNEQILQVLGGALPKCIREVSFTPDGFILEANTGRKLIPIYLAGTYGFSEESSADVQKSIISPLNDLGYYVFNPFEACAEYFAEPPTQERLEEVVDIVCYDVLMPRSKALVAILDGKVVDSGVAAEITAMAMTQGPVIGIMHKEKLEEEQGAPVNIMLRRYMNKTHGGDLFKGEEAVAQALQHLKMLRDEILVSQKTG